MSLRIKVMGIALALTVLIGLVASVEMRRSLQAKLDEELECGVVGVARAIASSFSSLDRAPEASRIEPTLWRVQSVNPDVRYVRLLRPQGELVAQTVPHHLRTYVTFNGMDSPRQPFQVRRFHAGEQTIREVSLPVDGGWGIVQVGMSENRMQGLVAEATTHFLRTLVVIGLVGMALAALATHWVTRPITELAGVARAVERGERSQRAKPRTQDEVGQLSSAFNAMLDSLEGAMKRNESLLNELHEKEQMRAELMRQLLSAQEEERRRIARELHDETAQLLASLLAELSAMANLEGGIANARARELLTLTEQTMTSLRQVALRLRPDALSSGLIPAVRERVDEYAQRFGFRAELETVGMEEACLPDAVETALYRIILEALTNIARHAEANHVSVIIERKGERVIAVVEDDGNGFELDEVVARPARQRFGLFGMEERAALVSGSVTVESSKGKGTTVRVECPIHPSTNLAEAGQP